MGILVRAWAGGKLHSAGARGMTALEVTALDFTRNGNLGFKCRPRAATVANRPPHWQSGAECDYTRCGRDGHEIECACVVDERPSPDVGGVGGCVSGRVGGRV